MEASKPTPTDVAYSAGGLASSPSASGSSSERQQSSDDGGLVSSPESVRASLPTQHREFATPRQLSSSPTRPTPSNTFKQTASSQSVPSQCSSSAFHYLPVPCSSRSVSTNPRHSVSSTSAPSKRLHTSSVSYRNAKQQSSKVGVTVKKEQVGHVHKLPASRRGVIVPQRPSLPSSFQAVKEHKVTSQMQPSLPRLPSAEIIKPPGHRAKGENMNGSTQTPSSSTSTHSSKFLQSLRKDGTSDRQAPHEHIQQKQKRKTEQRGADTPSSPGRPEKAHLSRDVSVDNIPASPASSSLQTTEKRKHPTAFDDSDSSPQTRSSKRLRDLRTPDVVNEPVVIDDDDDDVSEKSPPAESTLSPPSEGDDNDM